MAWSSSGAAASSSPCSRSTRASWHDAPAVSGCSWPLSSVSFATTCRESERGLTPWTAGGRTRLYARPFLARGGASAGGRGLTPWTAGGRTRLYARPFLARGGASAGGRGLTPWTAGGRTRLYARPFLARGGASAGGRVHQPGSHGWGATRCRKAAPLTYP
jgi:hypothetical protein